MGRPGLNEEQFRHKLYKLYGNTVELIGKYISMSKEIYVKTEYGIVYYKIGSQVLISKPSILNALNKTEYAMNILKKSNTNIWKQVKCVGEYISMKSPTVFLTKFGLVKTTFDNLIHGHLPTIRVALNKKEYFKNQLNLIYGDKYFWRITSTNRHGGKSILICPVHGEVIVDNDYIFTGKGCPKCNNITPPTTLYYIQIVKGLFSCYKIGVSYRKDGILRRYADYKKLGYTITVIKEVDFTDIQLLKETELSLKNLIKPYLITPPEWPSDKSTECFTCDIFNIILTEINKI